MVFIFKVSGELGFGLFSAVEIVSVTAGALVLFASFGLFLGAPAGFGEGVGIGHLVEGPERSMGECAGVRGFIFVLMVVSHNWKQ
jgi:hypothetical protein